MLAAFGHFLAWTFLLYILHRIVHKFPVLKKIHADHHGYINNNSTKWHWSNLFLYNDTWTSTLDLWITEVIPTLVFSYLTGHWWITVFYYLWAAFLQESLEHNKKINLYPLTFGKWHLVHHKYPKSNFGLFFPFWDKLFSTERQTQI